MGSIAKEITVENPELLFTRKGKPVPYAAVAELRAGTKSQIIVRGEAPKAVYEKAIDRFNQRWVAEAAIIVKCQTDEDVSLCLHFVQKYDIDMTVTCGGHSYYGASSTRGLIIDLTPMKKVVIDKEAMTVTAGGGCKAIDVETPLQKQGLYAVFGAANDTGIGGLTLGGGSGFLTGQYGLVCDNLVGARVVLADGRVVYASDKENTDLFWGIRGGGSNFGIVTEFKYRCYKQHGPTVFYAELRLPPTQNRAFLELAAPMQEIVDQNGGKLVVFMTFNNEDKKEAVHPLGLVLYDGPEEAAMNLITPLLNLQPHLLKFNIPYAMSTVPGPTMFGPSTHRRYSTSNAQFVHSLDIDIIMTMLGEFDAYVKQYGEHVNPSRVVIEIRSYAKTASVPIPAMAYASRRRATLVIMEGQYDTPALDAEVRNSVKTIMDKVRASVEARGLNPKGGAFFNANIASGEEKIADMFGENLPRMRQLKKKYDPTFLFNKWYPVAPEV